MERIWAAIATQQLAASVTVVAEVVVLLAFVVASASMLVFRGTSGKETRVTYVRVGVSRRLSPASLLAGLSERCLLLTPAPSDTG